LYRQIYNRLRDGILSGNLRPGLKLPSTRALAADLGVARNTVMNAYEQLLAEGYVEGKRGSGNYVSQSLPEQSFQVIRTVLRPVSAPGQAPALSRRGAALAGIPRVPSREQETARAFRHGLPAVDEFPFELWARLTARYWRRRSGELLAYGDPAG